MLKLSRSGSNLRDNYTCVVHVSDDNSTDAVSDTEDVAYAVRHDELVWNLLLGAHDDGVSAANSDRRLSKRVDCLKGVLDLVNATVWRKNFH